MTSNTVLRRKIVILFIGILCIIVISFSIIVLKITGKAIRSSADSELLTQARHTAAVLDARMQSICTILESIAALPALTDQSIPFQSKARSLEQMSAAYKDFRRIYIADMIGIRYDRHGAAGTVDSIANCLEFQTII